MRTHFLLLLRFSLLAGSFAATVSEKGTLIKDPPPPSFTGTRLTPDSKHPYRAPRPGDQRGPCPGLNTLANHGYIPRNGIATFEQIVEASGEGFNMGRNISSALTAFTMLARGNPHLNLLSIGGPSPMIPPLPGSLDGPVVKGMGGHGRFEGDVSMTRYDHGVGDNQNFQEDLFDQLLLSTGQFGDDDPITGNRSIINAQVLADFKMKRFLDSRANNPGLEYHIGRFRISYTETGFTLELFANGTTGKISYNTAAAFFRDQTFPKNFWRRSAPAEQRDVLPIIAKVLSYNPSWLVPGASDGKGNYVPDTNATEPCAFQKDLVVNSVPAAYLNTTGILRQNVDFLVAHMNNVFGNGCPPAQPGGSSER